MEVILLTVFLSLLLAGLFLLLFWKDHKNAQYRSPEQEALRPFMAETPVEHPAKKPRV